MSLNVKLKITKLPRSNDLGLGKDVLGMVSQI